MSYIIAFVRFLESELTYPVNCYRTDINSHDSVLVSLADSRCKYGIVEKTEYLNWNCTGSIECKVSEAKKGEDGILLPPDGSPKTVGLATMEASIAHLREQGWVPLKPVSKTFRLVLRSSNNTQTANIFFRSNGVDLQIIPREEGESLKPWSSFASKITEGKFVRHFLSQTKFNLYEGIDRFSKSFLSNEGNYERFFISVGSSKKVTPALMTKILELTPVKEMSLREALAGCEDQYGRIYLCDDVYI